jgi:hypothetical protein
MRGRRGRSFSTATRISRAIGVSFQWSTAWRLFALRPLSGSAYRDTPAECEGAGGAISTPAVDPLRPSTVQTHSHFPRPHSRGVYKAFRAENRGDNVSVRLPPRDPVEQTSGRHEERLSKRDLVSTVLMWRKSPPAGARATWCRYRARSRPSPARAARRHCP